jgi:hypothetical protein
MKIIKDNYDDVLKLAHSIRKGKVSGSLIMGKLGSYSRQNSLATALREMGRIEKTIFILDYISSESIRRRIQKGLNKGEAMNALGEYRFDAKGITGLDSLRPLIESNKPLSLSVQGNGFINSKKFLAYVLLVRLPLVMKPLLAIPGIWLPPSAGPGPVSPAPGWRWRFPPSRPVVPPWPPKRSATLLPISC